MNTSAEGQDFLRRAAVWAPKASQAGLRWPSVLEWGPGGALAEDLLGFRLEQVARQLQAKIAAAQRQAQLQEVTRTIERLREELRSLSQRQRDLPHSEPASLPTVLPTRPLVVAADVIAPRPSGEKAARLLERDARWRHVIPHASVVLILGGRGRGKSALGYYLLELFQEISPSNRRRPSVLHEPRGMPVAVMLPAVLQKIACFTTSAKPEAYSCSGSILGVRTSANTRRGW